MDREEQQYQDRLLWAALFGAALLILIVGSCIGCDRDRMSMLRDEMESTTGTPVVAQEDFEIRGPHVLKMLLNVDGSACIDDGVHPIELTADDVAMFCEYAAERGR